MNERPKYGGIWIGAGVFTGVVLPLVLRLVLGRMLWPLVMVGGVILGAYCVVLARETRQDSGVPYYQRTLRETIPFDPETQIAVIRSSICTGERWPGSKTRPTGISPR